MEWMRDRKGFPVPDWAAFQEIVGQPDSRTLHDAVDIWLEALRDALGDAYEIVDSKRFVAISAGPPTDTDALLLLMERSFERLRDRLRDIASLTWRLKPLVLLFDGGRRFSDYVIAVDDGDLERLGPSAAYRPGGSYVDQFLFAPAPTENHELAILHALTHRMSDGHPYPYWVHEVVAAYSTEPPTRAVSGDWNEQTIQDFWSGQSFFDDDRGEASYALAAGLARKLSIDDDAFHRFVRTAHYRDLGDAAAREVFGMGVGNLAALVLGSGSWAPREQVLDESG